MYYFSPSDLAFNYGASIWLTAVEVSDETYQLLMSQLNQGYTIAADENGLPYSIPPEIPPAPPPIEDVFRIRLARLNNDFENAVQYLKSTYPLSEAITWPVQLAEAKSIFQWLVDNPTLTIDDLPESMAPFLSSLSSTRVALGYPSDLQHLAQRVIENDALFTPAMTHVTAIRHVTERSMLIAVAANDTAALNAVTWSYPFPPQVIE